jgi:AAA ATPase domain
MEYSFFEIENFRGIQSLRIDLASSPKSRCYPLVGLNESGKTTILEAINHFSRKVDENLDPLQIPGHSIKDIHTLIPISQRANFNGKVECKIGLTLDESDVIAISRFLSKERKLIYPHIGKSIVISHTLHFKDSKHDPKLSRINWTWDKSARSEGKRKAQNITGDDWIELIKFTRKMMPSILYFPTFLFDFPERVYLEDGDEVDEKHKFYRQVLQDILDASTTGANLKTHLLDRAKSGDNGDKKNLESLLLEMGRNVTRTVFDAWNQIFKTSISQRNVRFSWDKDSAGKVYIQLQLEDADGFYLLSERSLGFRWFFVFLLLTHYRGFRVGASKNVLFLLDEPASNLHASAQAQLLRSFQIISKRCMILYTTHSHHMIDPEFLDATYVVRNEGLGYESTDDAYSSKRTKINATKYRSFVSKHPDKTNYYKPILDVLDHQPSMLELVPKIVMLEGKTDFYLLKYFSEIILKDSPIAQRYFLPGTGSGNLGQSIRLYLGWAREFLVLLDSDSEGNLQKKRYADEFGLGCSERTFMLADANLEWENKAIEGLISDDDKLCIQRHAYPEEMKYNKTHFHRSLQEVLMRKVEIQISEYSKSNFSKLFTFLDSRFIQI